MIYILTNDNKKFYIDESFGVRLNLGVRDIRNLDTRTGSRTTRLFITGDDWNNTELGSIFNINVSGGFDRNKKIKSLLIKDGVTLMSGYFTLIEITNERGSVFYEIEFFDELIKFYLDLEEKLIVGNDNPEYDLDFSQWNHLLEITELQKSWQKDINGDPIYNIPYIYKVYFTDNKTRVNIDEFSPAFRVKDIIDAIFQKWGVYYESDFLNSKYFNFIVMPWGGGMEFIYEPLLDVNVGWTASCYNWIGKRLNTTEDDVWCSTETIGPDIPQLFNNLNTNYTWSGNNNPGPVNDETPQFRGGTRRIDYPLNLFNSGTMGGLDICTETTSPPPQQVPAFSITPWSTRRMTNIRRIRTLSEGLMNVEFNLPIEIGYQNNNSLTAYPKIIDESSIEIANVSSSPLNSNFNPIIVDFKDDTKLRLRVHLCADFDTSPTTTEFYSHDNMIDRSIAQVDVEYDFPIVPPGGVTQSETISGIFVNVPVTRGGHFIVVVEVLAGTSYYDAPSKPNIGWFGGGLRFGFQKYTYEPQTEPIRTRIKLGGSSAKLLAYFDEKILAEGNPIRLNRFLPKELGQKEFLKGIFNMFNLQIQPIKSQPDKFLIEPRDAFFKKGEVVDLRVV